MTAQRTLAIVKPDAVSAGKIGRIVTRIEEAGFTVVGAKLLHMTASQAGGFYAVHKERPFYASLCRFMTQGPSLAMVLEADNAIARWRDLMGATDPAKAAAGTIRRTSRRPSRPTPCTDRTPRRRPPSRSRTSSRPSSSFPADRPRAAGAASRQCRVSRVARAGRERRAEGQEGAAPRAGRSRGCRRHAPRRAACGGRRGRRS